MCEMCLREDVELIGFGICAPCDALNDAILELIYQQFTHVSPKNALRYMLTKEHEVNSQRDHTDDDVCVYMHADCTHD